MSDLADAELEPGRRERKKRQTRDELMLHAARLFAERGFDAVTTEDIADAADVSQRTFFRHFPSKEAVLYGHVDELRDTMRSTFLGRPDDEHVVDAMRASVRTIAEHYAANHDEAFLQARLAAEFPSVAAHARAVVQTDWEHELTAVIAERMDVDPLADPFPEVLAGAAFAAFRSAIRRWGADGGRSDFGTLLDESLDVLAALAD
ncbi:MAG: TetR family transcriptional regulator [Actinomycetota bacterium]